LRTDGTLWAWGNNLYGQLGLGLPSLTVLLPKQVAGAATWQTCVVGDYHSLALRADGTLWSCGQNFYGQLGSFSDTSQPTLIPRAGVPLATTPGATAPAWTLAPNPAHDWVQASGLPATTALYLYDAQGRLVRTAAAAHFSLVGLAPGLYLMRPATSTGQAQRLLVQ